MDDLTTPPITQDDVRLDNNTTSAVDARAMRPGTVNAAAYLHERREREQGAGATAAPPGGTLPDQPYRPLGAQWGSDKT